MLNTPRTMNSAPRKMARSFTDQSTSRMIPPATMLTIPLRSSTHQPLLTDRTSSRFHDFGASGLVTSM